MNWRNIATVALFGSIWGFMEATVGGLGHHLHIPLIGTFMTCIGYSILYAALRSGLRPAGLAAVALVAASFKFADSWLFGLPLSHILILNPANSIAMQGLAFALVFGITKSDDRFFGLAWRFLITAAVAMVAFNIISRQVLGWETTHTISPMKTVLIRLPLMTLGSAFLARAIVAISNRTLMTLTTGWQAATAAICAILAIAARWTLS
jgi:hypothetical protein